jgi:hypothetical protein
MNLTLGWKRLLVVNTISVFIVVFIYFLWDEFLIPRRKFLYTVEIILYIMIANVFSILLYYSAYRAVRWIAYGFKVVRGENLHGVSAKTRGSNSSTGDYS